MEFRKSDNSVYQTFLELIEETFPELSSFSFGLLFRQKIKKSKGGLILAEVCLPSKLLSYYAKNEQGNPYDFLIIFDEMVWACANKNDRVRILRHELRHVHITEKGDCRMIGHDFADFHIEVELNADDAMWGSHLAEVTVAAYKQIKEGGRDPRVDRTDAPEATVTHKDEQRQTHLDLGGKTKLDLVETDCALGDGQPDLDNDYFTEEAQGKTKVPESDSNKYPGKESKLGALNAGIDQIEAGIKKGVNGAMKVLVVDDNAPDEPVDNASAKLDALSKKRGLRVPAAATQI